MVPSRFVAGSVDGGQPTTEAAAGVTLPVTLTDRFLSGKLRAGVLVFSAHGSFVVGFSRPVFFARSFLPCIILPRWRKRPAGPGPEPLEAVAPTRGGAPLQRLDALALLPPARARDTDGCGTGATGTLTSGRVLFP